MRFDSSYFPQARPKLLPSCRHRDSMKLPKYHLKAESRFTRFEFISEGPKGAIRKLIEFQATTDPRSL